MLHHCALDFSIRRPFIEGNIQVSGYRDWLSKVQSDSLETGVAPVEPAIAQVTHTVTRGLMRVVGHKGQNYPLTDKASLSFSGTEVKKIISNGFLCIETTNIYLCIPNQSLNVS